MNTNSPIVVGLLAAVVFGPMVYRLAMPMPSGDQRAIELFLRNREQKLLRARKLWIGGPPRYGGRGVYTQTGRPYRVIAQSADGSNWTHDLAADGPDALGNPTLNERISGVWTPVIQ